MDRLTLIVPALSPRSTSAHNTKAWVLTKAKRGQLVENGRDDTISTQAAVDWGKRAGIEMCANPDRGG
jgi:hypothetical protein